jgi:hypothetical protein
MSAAVTTCYECGTANAVTDAADQACCGCGEALVLLCRDCSRGYLVEALTDAHRCEDCDADHRHHEAQQRRQAALEAEGDRDDRWREERPW